MINNNTKYALTPLSYAIRYAERGKPVFYTDSHLALRPGELLGLRWLSFNEEESTIRVDRNLFRGELQDHAKTVASEATMPVTSKLKGILLHHKKQSAFTQPEDYIFCKKDGHPACPDQLRRSVLYPAMDRAGIKRTKGTTDLKSFVAPQPQL